MYQGGAWRKNKYDKKLIIGSSQGPFKKSTNHNIKTITKKCKAKQLNGLSIFSY